MPLDFGCLMPLDFGCLKFKTPKMKPCWSELRAKKSLGIYGIYQWWYSYGFYRKHYNAVITVYMV